MGGGDNCTIGKLLGGVKKLKIDDQDASTPSRVRDAFTSHWCQNKSYSPPQFSTGHGNQLGPTVLFSSLDMSEDTIYCGLSNGEIVAVDPSRPSITPIPERHGRKSRGISTPSTENRRHNGLTSLVCSKTQPGLVYTISGTEGNVCVWDFRARGQLRPTNCFSGDSLSKNASDTTEPLVTVKPLISLDISVGDQIVCAGTEVVGEDSLVLFWDARNANNSSTGGSLLGAYWESHSEDITAVRFHPQKCNELATASTDGLVNVFDLFQPSEDDALLFSLNTELSVESLHWSQNLPNLPASCLSCVTHCNQVQLWDVQTGDRFAHFDRSTIAKAMMRTNSEAVYVTRCYQAQLKGGATSSLGILTCSLKGSCTRFVTMNGDILQSNGLFSNHSGIVQTAEYIGKSDTWITFNEEDGITTWSNEDEGDDDTPMNVPSKKRKCNDDTNDTENSGSSSKVSLTSTSSPNRKSRGRHK